MKTLQVTGRGRQAPAQNGVRPDRGKECGGSASVEAAIVFPVLIVLLALFLRMIPVYSLQLEMQRTLSEDSATAALAAAVTGEGDGEDAAAELARTAAAAAALSVHLHARYYDRARAAGMTGVFNTAHTRVSDGMIDLCVVTDIRVRGIFGTGGTVRIITRSRQRAFSGVSLRPADEEELVYVTSTGTVYHRSMSCPYIRAAVVYCPAEKLPSARSSSGEIYRPCPRCGPSASDSGFYVTPYGNHYHSTENCTYLLHNVTALPLSEASGSYRPCSKCGGEAP